MQMGFVLSCLLSTGGFGTQLKDTLLPWRLVGMLLVRDMFRRILPANVQQNSDSHTTSLYPLVM